MKKLKAILSGAFIALLVSMATTPSIAGSADFAGPYIALQMSVNGAELSGEHIDEDGANTEGTGGKVFPLIGGEIGYNIPMGEIFYLTLGASVNPGSARITEANDFADAADVTVTLSDQVVYFIRPSIAFSSNSSAFIKLGKSEANVRMTETTTPFADLKGNTYAIGTTTLYDSGMFIQTEVGITDFDDVTATGIGSSSSAVVNADPNMAYGNVAIGYKF